MDLTSYEHLPHDDDEFFITQSWNVFSETAMVYARGMRVFRAAMWRRKRRVLHTIVKTTERREHVRSLIRRLVFRLVVDRGHSSANSVLSACRRVVDEEYRTDGEGDNDNGGCIGTAALALDVAIAMSSHKRHDQTVPCLKFAISEYRTEIDAIVGDTIKYEPPCFINYAAMSCWRRIPLRTFLRDLLPSILQLPHASASMSSDTTPSSIIQIANYNTIAFVDITFDLLAKAPDMPDTTDRDLARRHFWTAMKRGYLYLAAALSFLVDVDIIEREIRELDLAAINSKSYAREATDLWRIVRGAKSVEERQPSSVVSPTIDDVFNIDENDRCCYNDDLRRVSIDVFGRDGANDLSRMAAKALFVQYGLVKLPVCIPSYDTLMRDAMSRLADVFVTAIMKNVNLF